MLRASKEPCSCGKPKSQVAKTCFACRRNRELLNCVVCGTGYESKRSKNQRACSRACAVVLRGRTYGANRRSEQPSLVCEQCGTTRSVRQSREHRRFCSSLCWYRANCGASNPKWQGGISTEREVFNSSVEWKDARKAVWRRENATCQRCCERFVHDGRPPYEVHHVAPFAVVALRVELSNLMLLCGECHDWVHSNANVGRELIAG